MKYMGIDYGGRRVGIALSDETGEFALPKCVLENSKALIDEVVDICLKEGVGVVVLGESKNYQGEENAIMKKVHAFKAELEKRGAFSVVFEPEFMTSVEAERLQGKHNMSDASAAAIILKSYLDKKKSI